ncbi:MAG: hypothetical protein J6D21_12020 [Clostridia bacterium]|nr:hypothetical protein [Clostridia bacterium]
MYITPEKVTANVILPVPGWWVAGDLEKKILRLYPFFEFVLDEQGNLCDVKETEPQHE